MRKRAREQEVQRGLVLDAVGAAVRGDRLVPVLHEEVSENISHRDEQQHRERYEREVGRGHMARWSKRLGGDTVESPLTHPLVQGACVWASGRQQETSELHRQHDHRWGSPAEDADSSYAVFIHLCMEKKTGNWLQRSAVHQADVKSEKKKHTKKKQWRRFMGVGQRPRFWGSTWICRLLSRCLVQRWLYISKSELKLWKPAWKHKSGSFVSTAYHEHVCILICA